MPRTFIKEERVQTITLTYGLPASGKSTWAKEQVENSNGKIVRVNMDDIRAMLGLPYSKDAEALALDIQDQMIVTAIESGKDVIVDNTHLRSNMPKRYKKLFDGDVLFKIQDFTDVNTVECIFRDTARKNKGKRFVGAQVIRDMAKLLDKPWRLTEEFMNDKVLSPPLEYDPSLPWAVVFDTDGTTAHHNRSPYDYPQCYTDTVDENIKMLLKILYEQGAYDTITLIGMSGRPDTWREMTEQWYQDNDFWYDEFYMRPEGDSRPDTVVKQEMYDKYIRGNYNVLIHLDDRNSVVRAIRKLGVKVGQVAYGNF
jgi:predicted kinase